MNGTKDSTHSSFLPLTLHEMYVQYVTKVSTPLQFLQIFIHIFS